LTPVSRANLIVDGKLDHAAITAELRRCLNTLLQKGRFQLSFEIRSVAPAAAKEFENPEIVVEFKGPDQDLLLEHNAELLLALEHISLRWLWLDPQFYGRIRIPRHSHRGIEAFRPRGRRPRPRDKRSVSLQRHVIARTPHPASGPEGRARSPQRKRRRRRRPPGRRLPSELG
jgi:hypothetical protein